jgi:hypothetical protein
MKREARICGMESHYPFAINNEGEEYLHEMLFNGKYNSFPHHTLTASCLKTPAGCDVIKRDKRGRANKWPSTRYVGLWQTIYCMGVKSLVHTPV